MARRFHPQSTPRENLHIVLRSVPWKLLILLPVLVVVAIPTYLFGAHIGGNIVPTITKMFYTASGPQVAATPTPPPAFPMVLPQIGSLLYTVQEGDSCDSILTYQMRMAAASEVFSDVKPETIRALNDTLGQDCHKIQPGIVIPLSPQYPLVALGGTVQKIEALTPQQVLPTPLINVPNQPQYGPDCSGGCILTVRIASGAQVRLTVQTTLSIHPGAWIWTQAQMARKAVPGFATYPYADPKATLNGMSLQACDFQVDNTHDDTAPSCDQLMPNSIESDHGSWLFAVTGPGGLDHWHYALHVPSGTRVLLWLSRENGSLKFRPGNPVYHYNDVSHLYEKV